MTSQEDLKRRKAVRISQEFINMLFEHPDNYYIKSGIPEGSNFLKMYNEPSTDTTYIIFQNDDWEPLHVGEAIPELDVEFRERFCQRCDTEMMYDESEEEQYCPRCERKFYCGG